MSICYVSFKKIEKLIRYTHRFNFINQTKCVGLLRPFNVIRSADFTLPMQLSTEVLGHICLETLFNKKSYHTETSQLIFDANQLLVSTWYELLLKDISEQTTNFCILAFCKDQKVLALVLPITKKSDNDTKFPLSLFAFISST